MTDGESSPKPAEEPGSQRVNEEVSDVEIPDEEAFIRATMYFQETTKRDFERWLKRLELEHPEIDSDNPDLSRRMQYEALIHVVMNNEEEFIERVKAYRG